MKQMRHPTTMEHNGRFGGGLGHATSLTSIDVSTQADIHQTLAASYESEDENMGRRTAKVASVPLYSKEDIREQYCITDRQLDVLEKAQRSGSAGFFGCLSSYQDSPCDKSSILSVCVRRTKVPSDENIHELCRRGGAEFAPYPRYPRYPFTLQPPAELYRFDQNLDCSYFRRRPQRALDGPKRYTWMPEDEESIRMERPRSLRPDDDDARSSMTSSTPYLSYSSEYLVCAAHPDLPPPPPPPSAIHRTKHVSFARSHTLTSFNADANGPTPGRSQERLLDTGRKTPELLLKTGVEEPHPEAAPPPKVVVLEKVKRGPMKTQATQTEVCLGRKLNNLSLSPRTIQRVKMVSQGAQTNGGLLTNGTRKLTKSYSEAGSKFGMPEFFGDEETSPPQTAPEHEPLQRTQSEEPPKSPRFDFESELEEEHIESAVQEEPIVVPVKEEEEDEGAQQEIIIDFEPQISPDLIETTRTKKKRLLKTMSEGEILQERRKSQIDEELIPQSFITSSSQENIKSEPERTFTPYFLNSPILHEDIFKEPPSGPPSGLFSPVTPVSTSFQTQESMDEEFHENLISTAKMWDDKIPAPASPSVDGGNSISLDSLKDDTIWNESQVTVLPADSEVSDLSSLTATSPASRRKQLLHQLSSMDTDAFEEETTPRPVPPIVVSKPERKRRIEEPEAPPQPEIPKLNSDVSESTTDDYVTATQSSTQGGTQEGSSFESASSIYSLARGEAICISPPPILEETVIEAPPAPRSPSGSSSSCGSYSLSTVPKPKVSDDEESSSVERVKVKRDWSEEEKRRRKKLFKLELSEKEEKPDHSEDESSGGMQPTESSPRRHRRIIRDVRRKSMIQPIARTRRRSVECKTVKRRQSIQIETPATIPRRRQSIQPPESNHLSPHRSVKAVSAESLRSVSPGSDSVFEHQIHCLHCGKEVDIVADVDVIETKEEIVRPPADFADSPDGVAKTKRLYKKLDKRFRSEERGERRGHRYRADIRAKSEERGRQDESSRVKLRPLARSTESSLEALKAGTQIEDEEDLGIYLEPYKSGIWIFIGDNEEKYVWHKSRLRLSDEEGGVQSPLDSDSVAQLELTNSETEFQKKYQCVTHRMVHRKSCLEMYKRQANKSFESDKTVIVHRHHGEFGFRIHGSKPVVVSAIEPDTPAETSGLEVGDIVISVNGVNVLDKSHSEVVKIAHAGSETLELEVTRTCNVLIDDGPKEDALYSGYLWKLGGNGKWVRRWFMLKRDNCLYWYRMDGETQPMGALMLINYAINPTDTNKQFSFSITKPESIGVDLAADSESTQTRWIAVISHAIERYTDTWLEQTRRNLRLAPNFISRPDCFGYLMKLGVKWKSWGRRYCVLKDACLYFYADANAKNAYGMVCFHGYRVQAQPHGTKKYAFEVIPPENTDQKHYYFHTESDLDRKRWIAALEYSIDRWLRVG